MFAIKTHLLVHRSVEPLFNFYSSGEVDSRRGMELSSALCKQNRGFIFWYTVQVPFHRGRRDISRCHLAEKNMKMRRDEKRRGSNAKKKEESVKEEEKSGECEKIRKKEV